MKGGDGGSVLNKSDNQRTLSPGRARTFLPSPPPRRFALAAARVLPRSVSPPIVIAPILLLLSRTCPSSFQHSLPATLSSVKLCGLHVYTFIYVITPREQRNGRRLRPAAATTRRVVCTMRSARASTS